MISKEEERDARCLPVIQKPVIARIPELYPENLETLKQLMGYLEDLSRVNGVFEIEIRVRIDDVDTWAVIGWGEAGDPCVLRFESEPVPPTPVKRSATDSVTSIQPFDPKQYLINKAQEENKVNTCSCGDFSHRQSGGSCGPNGCYNRPA